MYVNLILRPNPSFPSLPSLTIPLSMIELHLEKSPGLFPPQTLKPYLLF